MPRTMARVVCTLWLTIETLAPTRRFTKRRFSGIGRADQGDEAGMRFAIGFSGDFMRHIVLLPSLSRQFPAEAFCQMPSRSSIFAAATCSAARFERSTPVSGFTPTTSTVTVKRGS